MTVDRKAREREIKGNVVTWSSLTKGEDEIFFPSRLMKHDKG